MRDEIASSHTHTHTDRRITVTHTSTHTYAAKMISDSANVMVLCVFNSENLSV